MKIVFASSSGGHFEQLMMLRPLMDKYDSVIVTEKTDYSVSVDSVSIRYLLQVNRKEALFFGKLLVNLFQSIKIYHKEKPDIMITTGVLAIIPLALIMKLHKKKLVYIESFAKVSSRTLSGKFLYRYSDQFYVQWPEMKKLYPNAIFVGGIY